MLTPELLRAGRALLAWTQQDLSTASRVSLATIRRLEAASGPLRAHAVTLDALHRALVAGGVDFLPDTAGGGCAMRLRAREAG